MGYVDFADSTHLLVKSVSMESVFDLPRNVRLLFRLDYEYYWIAPLNPYPPLRLAGRPNRGHTEGGGWTPSCDACL